MSKVLGIVGAGELGLQIAHIAISDRHYDQIVFFDDFVTEKTISGYSVVGRIEDIEGKYRENFFDEILIAIGYRHLDYKEKLYNQLNAINIPFGRIIHTTAIVDSTSVVEQGSVVYAGSCIDAKVIIKANTIINLSCTIAHDNYIGKHSFLAPRVSTAGFVRVGEKCFLGINTTLIDNLVIANSVQTGAGAVVIDDIQKKGLYVGNPAILKFTK